MKTDCKHGTKLTGQCAYCGAYPYDTPLMQTQTTTNQNKAKFVCNCGGQTKIENDSSVLHDCKAQPGCKVFDYPRGFVRHIRVQINPQLTNGVEKYNWFVDWQSK